MFYQTPSGRGDRAFFVKLIFWEADISGSENTENCLYCLSRSRDAQQAPIRYKICYFIPRICLYLTNKRKTWYQIFFQQYELRFWIGNFLFCTKHEKFKNPAIWSESPLIHILYLTLLLEIILERFFFNPCILTALCGWNLDRKFWVFLQMLNDFKTISFRSRNQPPIGPELIHFPKKYISSKIIAKTLLEMMSLITLCDFEIFQFSPENSKFSIQTQLRGATRIEKQTETNPDWNTL